MTDKTKVLIAIVGTALVVGGTTAVAAGGNGAGPQAGTHALAGFGGMHRGPMAGHDALQAAADYLGLSADELFTQLRSGKTLAALAQGKGKSVDGLKAAMVASVKSDLDAAVKDGRLTQAQADTMLQRFKDTVSAMVTTAGAAGERHAEPGALMQAAAKYLGLTAVQLHEQLDGGKSLADVAKAQGKSVDGLKSALVDAFKGSLDDLVNAKHAGPPAGFGMRHGMGGGPGLHRFGGGAGMPAPSAGPVS